MTTMSRPFSRTAIIPVSFLMFVLFILSGSPTTFPRAMILFLIGGRDADHAAYSVEGARSHNRHDADIGSAAGVVSSGRRAQLVARLGVPE